MAPPNHGPPEDSKPKNNIAVWSRLLLTATLAIAVASSTAVLLLNSRDADTQPFVDVLMLLDREYVEPLTNEQRERMRDAALSAMVASLGDPATVYVEPAFGEAFDEAITGSFAGIGALVSLGERGPEIVTPLVSGPAYTAGIRPGDLMLEIDGISTVGETLPETIARVKGVPGTIVKLLVERDVVGPFEVEITRGSVNEPTVRGFMRQAGSSDEWSYLATEDSTIALIRLERFDEGSAEAVAYAIGSARLAALEAGSALGGIVLDLRDNGGGRLDQAVEIADLFLEGGPIVSVVDRAGRQEMRSATPGVDVRVPVAVLMNSLSASASEVVAGALLARPDDEDDGIAPPAIGVGARTFGKGSVQSVYGLPSRPGARVKLTEATYRLPDGRSIHRLPSSDSWGVMPTDGFTIELDNEQELAWREARAAADVLDPGPTTIGGAARAEPTPIDLERDPQFKAAIEALRVYTETGAWPIESSFARAEPPVESDA